MNRFDWLAEFIERLTAVGMAAPVEDEATLAPARRLVVAPANWGYATETAAAMGLRHAGLWADPPETLDGTEITIRAALERAGGFIVLETRLPVAAPVIASQTPWFPGVDRLERHAHDLTGVRFEGHPDRRRWTRHQGWAANEFPLRAEFPVEGRGPDRTPADSDYPFVKVQGNGVYEIPVGPVHAGIIEPGHFRFHAMGEEVLRLEERLGYVHKGIEKIAVGRDPAGLARLAGRVSGDSTVAHAWAACQAMERAAGCQLPPRALWLRAILAERERIANHLGDIGAVCNDVAFSFALAQCARLREQWQRRSHALFGHRFMMDLVIPGGVARDLPPGEVPGLHDDHHILRKATRRLFAIIDDQPSLDDRLVTTGRLSTEQARTLGCTGYVGRASGLPFDLRRDAPYAPYDTLEVGVPAETDGDVAARVRVRMAEVQESLLIMDRLLRSLPAGPVAVELPRPEPGAAGLGLVEGWRGEVLTFVRFDAAGRIARFFPRDPSWFTWPALERLIMGNIVPDFPVCNKSVNGSYSGVDL